MDDVDKAERLKQLSTWTDEQYALVATKLLDKQIAGRSMTLSYQLDVGKWLLASLLVMNGGALVAIANGGTAAAQLFAAGGSYFVGGMVAALASGFFAWANAWIVTEAYDALANPWIIVSRESWVGHAPHTRWATPATVLSVLAGIASVGLFAFGALAAGGALPSTQHHQHAAKNAD